MGIDKILNETRKAAKEYKKRTAAKTQQSAPVVEKPAPTINWHQMNVDRLNRDIAVGKQKTEELNRKYEYTGGETPTTIQDMALKPSTIGKFTAPKTQASPFAPTKENVELLKQLQKSNSEKVEKAKKFFGEKENADWGYYLDRMNNVTRQEVEGLLAESEKRRNEWINKRKNYAYTEEISNGVRAEDEKIKLYNEWLEKDTYNSLKSNPDYEIRNFYREKNGDYEDEIYKFLTSGSDLERDKFIMNDLEGNSSVYGFMVYMNEEERKNYVYLYNTKGKEDARKYYQYIEPELINRADERVMTDSYNFGVEHPVLASVSSRLMTPLTSALSTIGNVQTILSGKVDENNNFTRGTRIKGEMDRGVMDEHIESDWGKTAYGVTASLLDNVVNALVSKKLVGGAGATPEQSAKYVSRLTSTLMSSEVMANGVIDAKKMGLDDADAITVGIARGVTEYLTEKWSIEKILKEPTTVLKALRKATVAEGTEETFSNWINRVIDTIAYGDRNSITKAYNEQIENGASEKQAFFSTVWKIIGEDALAFVGGALGGGLMTAGGMGVDITRYGGVKNYNKVLETRARWSQMSDEEVETEIKGMRIAQAAQALAKENTEPSDIALALSVLGVENPEKAAMAIVNFKENGTEMPEEYVSNPEFWDVVSTLKNKGYFRTNSEKSEIKPQSDGTNAAESVTKPPESVTKPPESVIRLEVKADNAHPQYQVDAMVDSLLAEGKRQFDTAYEQETEAGFDGSRAEFLQRYNRYYLKGLNGGKLADADARYADTLSLATRKAAFKAGRADRNAALDAKYVKSNEAIIRDGGVMRNHNTEGLDNETVKAMDKFGKRFGVAVEVADSVTKADGTEVNGEYANGKIRINASRVSGNKLILAVAQHEIAHRVQELMPKQYQKLRDIAYNIVTKDGYSAETYAKERGLDLDSAIDEVVCDFIARKDFALRVAEEDMSLAQKIKNWLKDILDTVGIKQYTDLERAYRAWEKAVTKAENTVKSEQRKGNTISNDARVDGEGEVKYSYSGENAKSIKEQLQTNANALNEMEVVAKTEYTNFNSSKKQVLKRVSEKFKKMGYSVERKGFGRIEISEKLINTGLNYLNDEAEYAAFDTIDKVLKHGISIEDRGNHKNREHGTITFAAPVEINGVRGNVAVVVKETKGHRYKTHRILMPNGSAFVLNEKTEATTDWMTIKNDGESQSIASAFKDNISQNNSIVNTNDMQNNKKNSEGSLDYLVEENERLTKEAEFYKAQMQRSKEFAPDTKKMAQDSNSIKNENNVDNYYDGGIITDKEQMFVDDQKQLDNVVMQAQLKEKKKLGYLPQSGYAYTNDYFVMFESYDIGEYKFGKAIWVDGNEDLINYLQERLDNDKTNKSTRNINGVIADFRSGKGSNNRNNDFTEERRTNSGDDRLHRPEQRSRPKRHTGGNNEDFGQKYSEGKLENLLPKAQKELEELNELYGIIDEGENPARTVKIPKKIAEDENTMQYARTAAESKALDNDMAAAVLDAVKNGAFAYETNGDKRAWNQAKHRVKKYGYPEMMREWDGIVAAGRGANKDDIALGTYLIQSAANAGDTKTCVRLVAEVAALGTQAGQTVQAMRLLKKMDGAGQLVYVQQTIKNLQNELDRRLKDKAPKIEVSQELMERLSVAKDREVIENIHDDIITEIASQVPSTWFDKWNAWRYLAMLGNPRTHIRNIMGNAVFVPAVTTKNIIGGVLESSLDKASRIVRGKSIQRTKTAMPVKKIYKEFAAADYAYVENILSGGGKMTVQNKIDEKRRIFKTKVLEGLRIFNNNMLEAEDRVFLKRHYIDALSSYLQANKVDVNILTEGNAQGYAILEKARSYAIKEAQKATFRDASSIASALNGIRRNHKVMGYALDSLLPFTKTPINILKRGIEYSPASLIDVAVRGTYKISRGDMTASDYIDKLATGLTGTGIMVLGIFLANMGILKGSAGDDNEEFEQLLGKQRYAVYFNGGKSNYTVDWLAPSSLPLFVGAEISRLVERDDGMDLQVFLDALTNLSEPIFELSMLDGINNALESIANKSDDDKASVIFMTEMMTSYVGQAVPTLLGQITRTFADDTRRKTYIDKNSKIPNQIQHTMQKQANKIPWLVKQQQPYIDEWGREEKTESMLERAFENFISPGYFSTVNVSPMEDELMRLAMEKVEGVYPKAMPKYFDVNKKRKDLTASEYTKAQTKAGGKAYELLTDLYKNDAYDDLTDEQKGIAIGKIYDITRAMGKKSVAKDYEADTWIEKAIKKGDEAIVAAAIFKSIADENTSIDGMYKVLDKGFDMEGYIEFTEKSRNYTGKGKQEKIIELLKKMKLSDKERAYYFSTKYESTKNNPWKDKID